MVNIRTFFPHGLVLGRRAVRQGTSTAGSELNTHDRAKKNYLGEFLAIWASFNISKLAEHFCHLLQTGGDIGTRSNTSGDSVGVENLVVFNGWDVG